MKRRLFAFITLIAALLSLYSFLKVDVDSVLEASADSTFSICFIDVGQGDSALVECDGNYMLIDGGDTSAGDKVYRVLEERGVQRLDILAVSHHHADHIGGLKKALTYASSIGLTISNSAYSDTELFRAFEHELSINGSKIKVPSIGDKYKLGSAAVEVVDVSAEDNNDSLVLLITYGDTRFLFTGDIEKEAQTRISDKYQNKADKPYKIDLIKMPHHGSYTAELYRFLRTFMPDYVVISVGIGNSYGHPSQETLDLLDSKTWKPMVYRTDNNGDIIVKSDGKKISVETQK